MVAHYLGSLESRMVFDQGRICSQVGWMASQTRGPNGPDIAHLGIKIIQWISHGINLQISKQGFRGSGNKSCDIKQYFVGY